MQRIATGYFSKSTPSTELALQTLDIDAHDRGQAGSSLHCRSTSEILTVFAAIALRRRRLVEMAVLVQPRGDRFAGVRRPRRKHLHLLDVPGVGYDRPGEADIEGRISRNNSVFAGLGSTTTPRQFLR